MRQQNYPNSRPALVDRQREDRREAERAEAYTDGNVVLNRAERRAYVKVNQDRQGRKNIVGFGQWRNATRWLERRAWLAEADAGEPKVLVAPRHERRTAVIRQAKLGRWLRRLSTKGAR